MENQFNLESNFKDFCANYKSQSTSDSINNWVNVPYIYPYVKEYYPVYLSYWDNKNKIEQAFKIVQILMKKDFIKIDKVKNFIEVVNEIAKEL